MLAGNIELSFQWGKGNLFPQPVNNWNNQPCPAGNLRANLGNDDFLSLGFGVALFPQVVDSIHGG